MKRLLLAVLLVGCAKHVPPPRVAVAPPPEEKPAPAPAVEHDDGMKLEGQLGTLSDADIANAWKTRWPEVARCSQAAQAKIGYLNGTVELKLRIGADGAPSKVFVQRSTLGSYDTEHCVLQIARGMTFPIPKGGAEAEFVYPIEIRARYAARIVDWEEARIAPTVARSKKDVGVCRGEPQVLKGGKHHAKQVKIAPPTELPPSLALTMYIGPGGRVSSAGLAAEGPIDENFAVCLLQRARTWKVDDPRGQVAKATIGVAQ